MALDTEECAYVAAGNGEGSKVEQHASHGGEAAEASRLL